MGSPGAILGTLWAILEPPGGFLEPPCGHLGTSCSHLEASWAIWRSPGGDLGPILPHFGSNLDHLRSLLVSFSTFSRPNFRLQRLLCIYVCVFVLLHLVVIFTTVSRRYQWISCKKHTRNTCKHAMWLGGMRGAFEYIPYIAAFVGLVFFNGTSWPCLSRGHDS